MQVHYSQASEEWSTPTDLFAELDEIFHFDLDACATALNAKCKTYFTKQQDALGKRWRGTVWMNPPYGRKIAAFMRKAYEESVRGATVVCLVPARTDTKWWHCYARRGQITHLPGRLRFGGAQNSAPFPSAIIIFWGGKLGEATRPAAFASDEAKPVDHYQNPADPFGEQQHVPNSQSSASSRPRDNKQP